MSLSLSLATGPLHFQPVETKPVPVLPITPPPHPPHVKPAAHEPDLLRADDGHWAEFKRLLWRRLPHIGVLIIALSTSEMLNTSPFLSDTPVAQIGLWALYMLASQTLVLSSAVALVTAVQVRIDHHIWRMMAIGIAVAATALTTSALRAFSDNGMFGLAGTFGDNMSSADRRGLFLYCFWLAVMFSGLLAIVYESQMRSERVSEALLKTRLDGETTERSTLESKLNVLKARVEPEFLFDVIARVESLYETNAPAAERLLEDLIDFLRATLPRTSAGKSTVNLEMQLCEAFLAVVSVLRNGALTVQVKIEPLAASGYFPPSVLLPLLQKFLPPRDEVVRPIHLLIAAERRDATICIEFTAQCNTPPMPEELMESAGLSLSTFFGEGVSVFAAAAPFGGQTIAIEVPHVVA